MSTPTHSGRSHALTRLRNYFLTGFVITAPLVITLYLIWTFVKWVDSWVIPYVPEIYNPSTYLPYQIPGIGLLIAIFMITIIGFLTANIIGRSIVSYGEHFVGRMPLVRNIYNGLKQIFSTVLSDESSSFQKVGLIEYPRPGLWAIVFIATETRGEVRMRIAEMGHETLSVFLPTTPNPTSGFLLFVPKEQITILDMSVEDGAKLVISAGLVTPKQQQKLKALAEGAAAGEDGAVPPDGHREKNGAQPARKRRTA